MTRVRVKRKAALTGADNELLTKRGHTLLEKKDLSPPQNETKLNANVERD